MVNSSFKNPLKGCFFDVFFAVYLVALEPTLTKPTEVLMFSG